MPSSHCCQSGYNFPLLPPVLPRDEGFSASRSLAFLRKGRCSPQTLSTRWRSQCKGEAGFCLLPCACKPMQSVGSGCHLGNLPWAPVGSVYRGVGVPRGQTRALGVAFFLLQLSWLEFRDLGRLTGASKFKGFLSFYTTRKKKKKSAWKGELWVCLISEKICSFICSEGNARRTI